MTKPLFADAARRPLGLRYCVNGIATWGADVSIERPAHIASMADRIMERGYRFECEVLSTGQVSLTVVDHEGDHDIELCNNGIEVPAAVDRLVRRFAAL